MTIKLSAEPPRSEPALTPAPATAALVAQALGGSQLAYTELHRRFVGLVHGLLLARHPSAFADELCQDCFALAFERLPQLRDPAQFGPWIAAMARHLRPRGSNTLSLESVCEPPDPCADPERHTEALSVLDAIRRLPMAYREPLLLRLVEGLSGAEIAAQTGLGTDSVRVNLHRGLRKLRALLAPESAGAPATEHAHE